MTEHKHPDDGGPFYPVMDMDDTHVIHAGVTVRARLAMQFAAAWLPIVASRYPTWNDVAIEANDWGLFMADDLIRRLKGES